MKYLLIASALFFASCANEPKQEEVVPETRPQIEMQTSMGTMVLELYNETPKHRDNFLKLVDQGAYDSLLFHRVIENFMIQAGDPESKSAKATDTLGEGDLGYTVPAEFHPDLFHEKGSLAAARENRPDRASSAIQFYLVQGKPRTDSVIDAYQTRINTWLMDNILVNDSAIKVVLDAQLATVVSGDTIAYDSLELLLDYIKDTISLNPYKIPEAHREVYRTKGGTPHLDQNYTVFGRVIDGLNIIDSIAAVETSKLDRPLNDVRILSMRLMN